MSRLFNGGWGCVIRGSLVDDLFLGVLWCLYIDFFTAERPGRGNHHGFLDVVIQWWLACTWGIIFGWGGSRIRFGLRLGLLV